MAKGHKGPGMGRKPIEISDSLFDKLIQLPLIKADIAHALSISEDTLDRYCQRRFGSTFAVQKDTNKSLFKGRLMAKQYEMAMKGNVQLLIWLGKNHLEQADKVESKVENTFKEVESLTDEQLDQEIAKMEKERKKR